MPLDSDVANADSHLHVEFYENKREPYNGKPFVRIMVPGDKTTIIDQPVRDDHKRRFPRQWLWFQSQNAGDTVPGTPLSKWHEDEPDMFTVGQMEELQILRFQVVEQVATASDQQLQRVGMGAVGLREKARMYLTRKNQSQGNSELQDLKEQVAQLTALLTQNAAPAKNKGGRPRKIVDGELNTASAHTAGNQ